MSLRGTFGPNSHLAIAYAAFSYISKSALDDDHKIAPIESVIKSVSFASDRTLQIASRIPIFYVRITDAFRIS